MGQFEPISLSHQLSDPGHGGFVWVLLRRCPNDRCQQVVLVLTEHRTDRVLGVDPPEVIDFDPAGIPDGIVESLEEAIGCHSAGYARASAIMVRRTLEELCAERGAEGANLAARVKDLGTKVIMPQAFLEGLDELRLFGNDATHIEARIYTEIGTDEVETVIEFTKEVLKAVYQSDALLERLKALRKGDEAG